MHTMYPKDWVHAANKMMSLLNIVLACTLYISPDTAFMFIIGGLLLVKVFQNRHPDIHANAFIAFFSFAVIIFCTIFGIVRLSLIIVLYIAGSYVISFPYAHKQHTMLCLILSHIVTQ